MSATTPTFKTFLCSYNVEGAEWGFEIKATSHDDANRRLRAIATNGRVDGELKLKIEVPSVSEKFVKWISAK